MNALKAAIPKPLAYARYSSKTLNIYKKAFRDPSRHGRIRELGWEDPSVRIANTVIWLLRNGKNQGLTTRNDGYVRVQDLLQHPRLGNLDFPAIERAVHSFRSQQLKLTYAPRNAPGSAFGSQVACWWIGLQPTTHEEYTDQPVINSDEVPDLIYQAPTQDWPTIRTRGISRGSGPPISFGTQTELPLHYQGDHTFIHMNTAKMLTRSDIKLYRSRIVNPKRGNKSTEILTSPALNVPPTMFQSAMRVAIERFPLILRETSNTIKKGKQRGKKAKTSKSLGKAVVMQAGIDALRNFGYDRVLDDSSLELMSKTQEAENKRERQRGEASVAIEEKTKTEDSHSGSTSKAQ